jgi:hypothetical protein
MRAAVLTRFGLALAAVIARFANRPLRTRDRCCARPGHHDPEAEQLGAVLTAPIRSTSSGAAALGGEERPMVKRPWWPGSVVSAGSNEHFG